MSVAPITTPVVPFVDKPAVYTGDAVSVWLLRQRWYACFGQVLAVTAVRGMLNIELPTTPLLLLALAMVVSNAVLWLRLQRRDALMPQRALAGVMVADVFVVTCMLALSGGISNPFAFIYLVYTALAATVLHGNSLRLVIASTFVGFGSLFVIYYPLPQTASLHLPLLYKQGLATAFVLASGFISYFVRRVTTALSDSQQALAKIRTQQARDERLTSLAALAASAAHGMATPLGTIAIAAKEMHRRLQRGGDNATSRAMEDAALIRQEVERCHDVLRQMAHEAGDSNSDAFTHVDPATLVEEAIEPFRERTRIDVSVDADVQSQLLVPQRSLAHTLRSIVDNALEASRDAEQGPLPVRIRVVQIEQTCYISVHDRGIGMAPEILEQACQPFFTTKKPGHGMGLGLFLARSIVERLGGGLQMTSAAGSGTTVVMRLPVAHSSSNGSLHD